MESKKKKKGQQHETSIPEDILLLILNRLPLKSLYRFKAVSRSWSPLIKTPPSPPPLFIGLFYDMYSHFSFTSTVKRIFRHIDPSGIYNSAIDPTLSFLPPHLPRDLTVHDSCNGLLLLRSDSSRDSYVCNPITKSFTRYEGTNGFSLLDFNPNVSPYFRIVSFSQICRRRLRICALSSETPTMRWRLFKPVGLQDHNDWVMRRHKHHALWEGSLYSLIAASSEEFADDGKIMRFSGLFDRDRGDVVHRQLIDLPAGTKKPARVCIGRLRNKLCLAGLDWFYVEKLRVWSPRLRVWSLSERDQTVWALEHDEIICSNHVDLYHGELLYIAGFHQLLDVVFILIKGTAYAYDLKKLSMDKVCKIGRGSTYDDGWLVIQASVFSFFPCVMDYQVRWKAKRKRAQKLRDVLTD